MPFINSVRFIYLEGFISWKEFEIQFLIALGHSEADAKYYASGRDEDIPLDIEGQLKYTKSYQSYERSQT